MTTSITGQGITAYKVPDDALSNESKNAVQNKVINGEVTDLQNAIGSLINADLALNIYNNAYVLDGCYTNTTGTTSNTNSSIAKVPVYDATYLDISNGIDSLSLGGTPILFVGDNDAILGYKATTNYSYKYGNLLVYRASDLPEGTKYIWFTVRLTAWDARNTAIVVKDSEYNSDNIRKTAIKVKDFYLEDNTARTQLKDNTQYGYGNLYNTSRLRSGYISNAGEITTSATYHYANIDISGFTAGNKITLCTGLLTGIGGKIVIDNSTPANKQIINPSDCDLVQKYQGFTIYELTIPSGATDILVNVHLNSYDARNTFIAIYGDHDQLNEYDYYVAFNKIAGMNIIDPVAKNRIINAFPLIGKTVVVIGDSITAHNYRAAKCWIEWMSEWYDFSVQNLGISGTGFKRTHPYIERIGSITSTPDIIGVAISLNDLVETIGTVNDTTTDGTVLGYANDFFDALQTAYPTTPIICYVQSRAEGFTPLVANAVTLVEGIETICKNKSVPCYTEMFWLGSELKPSIEANQQMYYTADGTGSSGQMDATHPNSKGHKIIARRLFDYFNNNVV